MYHVDNRCSPAYFLFSVFTRKKHVLRLTSVYSQRERCAQWKRTQLYERNIARSCLTTIGILPINNFLNTANSTITPRRWSIIHCWPRERKTGSWNECSLNAIAWRASVCNCINFYEAVSAFVGIRNTRLFVFLSVLFYARSFQISECLSEKMKSNFSF